MPGSIIAMGRLNRPAIMVYGGTIARAITRAKTSTSFRHLKPWPKTGRPIIRSRLQINRAARLPRPGACGGMYTANTMAAAIEALGMSLPFILMVGTQRREKTNACMWEKHWDIWWKMTSPLPNYDAPCFLKTPLLWQWSWEESTNAVYTWLPWLKVWMCILPSMTSSKWAINCLCWPTSNQVAGTWCRIYTKSEAFQLCSNTCWIRVGCMVTALPLPVNHGRKPGSYSITQLPQSGCYYRRPIYEINRSHPNLVWQSGSSWQCC